MSVPRIAGIACAVVATQFGASAQCQSWSQDFQSAAVIRDVEALETYGGAVHLFGRDASFTRRFVRFDGAQWTTLPTGPNGPVYDAATFDDGTGPKLYATGFYLSPGFNLSVWNGSSWAGVAPGLGTPTGTVRGRALIVHDDGSGPALYVGGEFTSPANRVARFDGTSFSAVGAGLPSEVYCFAVFDEGSGPRLFAGFAGGIQRWDGSAWTSVGSGAGGSVLSLAVHDDGSGPSLYGLLSTNRVQRWDGTSWTLLPAVNGWSIGDLASFDDGSGSRLYASFSGGPSYQLFRWDGAAWTALPGLIHSFGRLLATPQRLFIAGEVGQGPYGGLGTTGLASWNGSFVRHGMGADGVINALTLHDDGSGPALIAAGTFSHVGPIAAGAIARFDGSTWSPIGLGLNQPGWQAIVSSVAVYDAGAGAGQEIYATGQIQIAPLVHPTMAKWDGSTWGQIPGAPCCGGLVGAMVVHDDGSGPELFVAGGFTQGPSHNITKWNGTTWSPLAFGVGGSSGSSGVSALCVHDDGSGPRLYAAGNFAEASGVPAQNIARWDGAAWTAVGGGLPLGVRSLASHDDGSGPGLYASGQFSLGGSAGAARWDGSAWLPVGTGPGISSTALLVHDDGGGPALYSAQGAIGFPIVRKWDGSTWVAGSLSNGGALALASFDSGNGPALYVGGQFTQVDGRTSTNIARWSANADGTLVCLGDGSGTHCPCGNASAPSERAGCMNPFGTGGALRATGCATVTSDDVVLRGSGMTNGSALYIQGTLNVGIGAGAAFGDGLRCVGGSVIRLATLANVAGASSYPNATQTTPLSVRGMIPVAGGTRSYQAWYRVAAPLCGSGGWNLTNGVAIAWSP